MKGIITVEAAFVFPFVIYIIAGMIIITMMISDITIVQGEIYVAMQEDEKNIEKQMRASLEEKLMVHDVVNTNVNNKGANLKVSVKLSNRLHSFMFINIFDKEVTVDKSKMTIKECEIIRATDAIFN